MEKLHHSSHLKVAMKILYLEAQFCCRKNKYCALNYLMIIITMYNIELYMLCVFEIKFTNSYCSYIIISNPSTMSLVHLTSKQCMLSQNTYLLLYIRSLNIFNNSKGNLFKKHMKNLLHCQPYTFRS